MLWDAVPSPWEQHRRQERAKEQGQLKEKRTKMKTKYFNSFSTSINGGAQIMFSASFLRGNLINLNEFFGPRVNKKLSGIVGNGVGNPDVGSNQNYLRIARLKAILG